MALQHTHRTLSWLPDLSCCVLLQLTVMFALLGQTFAPTSSLTLLWLQAALLLCVQDLTLKSGSSAASGSAWLAAGPMAAAAADTAAAGHNAPSPTEVSREGRVPDAAAGMAGGPSASSTRGAYATCQKFEGWFAPERDVGSVLKGASEGVGLTDISVGQARSAGDSLSVIVRMKGKQQWLLRLLKAVLMKSPDKKVQVNSSVELSTGAIAVTVSQQGVSSQQLGRHACCWVLALLWEGVPSSSRPTSSDDWADLDDAMKAVQ